MPLYMDIHELHGESPEDIAKAHALDLAAQRKYGVDYRKYWLNREAGKLFCLCEAPNADAARRVHQEAHGKVAEKIIEINPPEIAEGFMGGIETNSVGAALLPGAAADARDPGIRTIFFTDIVGSTSLTQSV